MEKQNVVATLGTLALVANLLLPGMAFGQDDQQDQPASQNIDCVLRPSFNLSNFPDAVTFDSSVASNKARITYDAATNDDTPLPAANMLAVTDNRSGGVDGCPTTTPGFDVLATITTSLTNGTATIPDSSLRIITSTDHSTEEPCLRNDGDEVCYGAVSGTGNLHDIDAPEIYDDLGRLTSVHFDKFNAQDTYRELVESGATELDPSPDDNYRTTNTLDGNVLLLHTTTSHNMTMYTGVAINTTIPGNQDPGLYTGVIQYTLQGV